MVVQGVYSEGSIGASLYPLSYIFPKVPFFTVMVILNKNFM